MWICFAIVPAIIMVASLIGCGDDGTDQNNLFLSGAVSECGAIGGDRAGSLTDPHPWSVHVRAGCLSNVVRLQFVGTTATECRMPRSASSSSRGEGEGKGESISDQSNQLPTRAQRKALPLIRVDRHRSFFRPDTFALFKVPLSRAYKKALEKTHQETHANKYIITLQTTTWKIKESHTMQENCTTTIIAHENAGKHAQHMHSLKEAAVCTDLGTSLRAINNHDGKQAST